MGGLNYYDIISLVLSGYKRDKAIAMMIVKLYWYILRRNTISPPDK